MSKAKIFIDYLDMIDHKSCYDIVTNENKKYYVLKDKPTNFADEWPTQITDPKQIVIDLDTCDCCEKHQTNRPEKLELWKETKINCTQLSTDCYCPCRHYSRWLCRVFAEKPKEFKALSVGTCHRSQCEFGCNC